MEQHKIIVIDLGSQTTNLIARRIREAGVASEVVSHNTSAEELSSHNPWGIILSGSPFSLNEEEHYPKIDKKIFDLGVPILGICFGLYIVAEHLGGKIINTKQKEYGPTRLTISNQDMLFENIPNEIQVWMNHEDQASNLDLVSISASTKQCQFAAFADHQKKLYAVQFHPEVEHSDYGQIMLENFIFKICKAEKNWKLEDWVDNKITEIKSTIATEQALCAVSGGVDSTTAAVLCSKAIGKNLHCIFVNTGLMRKNEIEEVIEILHGHNLNLKVVHAEDRFFSKLQNVSDPEEKRKIIGHEYIKIFEEEAKKIGDIKYLIQGTIYSDKIESSVSALSSNIKSHHNVGGLPKKMNLKVYEPLDTLFKDEVRKLGSLIGLSTTITNRHPFPGPGLAIQIIGEITKEKVEIVRHADDIVIEEIKKAGLYNKIGEIFTNFVGVKTTGVKGDARSYEWLLAIRSVDPSDLMTSNWSRIDYEILSKISYRITSEVPGVNRVVYDITTKPPGTIRWE